MAAYNLKPMIKKWNKTLQLARSVDVLNPKNTVDIDPAKKFISPNSFPYLPIFNNISEERFTNPDREEAILFCGSLVPQKNPIFALEGFYSFLTKSTKSSAQLIFIGKGPLYDELIKRAGQINETLKREAIIFKDESELIQCLSVSKIFLSLQDFDNYPSQSLMEAMLFCNSIISIDNGDTRKLVDDKENNVLLQSKDEEKLGYAIETLLCRWQLNRFNRNHILVNFTPESFINYFFSLHEQITH
jgi:glycosyltransferase involved in cell wall biosynthesis